MAESSNEQQGRPSSEGPAASFWTKPMWGVGFYLDNAAPLDAAYSREGVMVDDGRLRMHALFWGFSETGDWERLSGEVQTALRKLSCNAVLTANCTASVEQALYNLMEDRSLDLVFIGNEIGLSEDALVEACEVLAGQMTLHDYGPSAVLLCEAIPDLRGLFERHGIQVYSAENYMTDILRARLAERVTMAS